MCITNCFTLRTILLEGPNRWPQMTGRLGKGSSIQQLNIKSRHRADPPKMPWIAPYCVFLGPRPYDRSTLHGALPHPVGF